MYSRLTLAEKVKYGKASLPQYALTATILFPRALEFVHAFLESVLSGEEDLVVCANIAYEKSLRRYHGWIVRGIFSVSNNVCMYLCVLFNVHVLVL